MFFTLVNAVKKTLKVVRKATGNFLTIFVVSLFMIVITLGHLCLFMYIIFMHVSSGRFDAR